MNCPNCGLEMTVKGHTDKALIPYRDEKEAQPHQHSSKPTYQPALDTRLLHSVHQCRHCYCIVLRCEE